MVSWVAQMTREQIKHDLDEYAVRAETMNRLKKAGLPMPKAPNAWEDEDIFAEWDNLKKTYGGVSNIPFNTLGDFLDKWSSIISYARWVEAIADMDLTTSREIRDTIKKQLYTIQEGSRELRDASVHTDPMYIEYEKKFVADSAMYTATRALREGYEYRANSISREITRRGADVMDGRRASNRGNGC